MCIERERERARERERERERGFTVIFITLLTVVIHCMHVFTQHEYLQSLYIHICSFNICLGTRQTVASACAWKPLLYCVLSDLRRAALPTVMGLTCHHVWIYMWAHSSDSAGRIRSSPSIPNTNPTLFSTGHISVPYFKL